MSRTMRMCGKQITEDDSCYFIYEDTDEKVEDDYIKGYLDDNLNQKQGFYQPPHCPNHQSNSVHDQYQNITSQLAPNMDRNKSTGLIANKITCDDEGVGMSDTIHSTSSPSSNETRGKNEIGVFLIQKVERYNIFFS